MFIYQSFMIISWNTQADTFSFREIFDNKFDNRNDDPCESFENFNLLLLLPFVGDRNIMASFCTITSFDCFVMGDDWRQSRRSEINHFT